MLGKEIGTRIEEVGSKIKKSLLTGSRLRLQEKFNLQVSMALRYAVAYLEPVHILQEVVVSNF